MTLEVYSSRGYYGSSDYFNVLIVYGHNMVLIILVAFMFLVVLVWFYSSNSSHSSIRAIASGS